MHTEIPKAKFEDDIQPCWIQCVDMDGKNVRPIVRCQCGQYIGLHNHQVHPDGTVTASFHHSNQPFVWKGQQVHNPDGCGWHVFLRLKDYSGEHYQREL